MGCGALNGPFGPYAKPAPETYEQWKKAGSTMLEVKKALLECGEPSPVRNKFIHEKALGIKDPDDQLNYFFLTDGCMEQSDFFVPGAKKTTEYCLWERHRHLPACQPGAVFPQRSVERRLNSWYCKIKTDREYCRQHAFTPSACDDPKIDYTNPPPECQP
jgi:hypothetical protein